MIRRLSLLAILAPLNAQQVADTAFRPPIERPAYPPGKGPVVLVDEAHRNFHTATGRYLPFAELLRRDGQDDPNPVPVKGHLPGAVLPFAKGRVAVFGEAAMFSAQLSGEDKHPMGMNAPVAKQNPQFLLNLMHWLTR